MSFESREVRVFAGIAGIVIVVGSFGPWATVLEGIGKVNGTDGDGWITLALSLIGVGVFTWKPRLAITVGLALLCGLGIVAVATVDLASLSRVVDESEFADALLDTGWGLYFCLTGGWALVAISLYQLLTEAPGLRFFGLGAEADGSEVAS